MSHKPRDFESLNRPLSTEPLIFSSNEHVRDSPSNRGEVGTNNVPGEQSFLVNDQEQQQHQRHDYGTAGSVASNMYPSITKNPASLDTTKSARRRRKQNDRCQLVLNQRTAEQQKGTSPNNAATAPSRAGSQTTRSIHGNENNIRALVRAPAFADVSDWLAIHTVDFYNDLSLLCGTILENCENNGKQHVYDDRGETSARSESGEKRSSGGAATSNANGGGGGCHMMTAGPKYKYLWKDDNEFTTLTEFSAAQYINTALEWIDSQLDDAEVFPPENIGYGPQFRPTVRKIFKLFFRIYAHLYHSHFSDFVALESETHLNDSFRHFIFFVKEFRLLNNTELPPLQQLISFLEEQSEAQERQGDQGQIRSNSGGDNRGPRSTNNQTNDAGIAGDRVYGTV
eukprot:INCI15098.1.p1 GENE.INCI15098.1~~INCI15098.1.p1  ORF type:complete len:460 (-),score=80.86 INCI15098.1:1331-2524(-)